MRESSFSCEGENRTEVGVRPPGIVAFPGVSRVPELVQKSWGRLGGPTSHIPTAEGILQKNFSRVPRALLGPPPTVGDLGRTNSFLLLMPSQIDWECLPGVQP